MSPEKPSLAIAHHEAGHVVVAAAQGVPVAGAELRSDGSGLTWFPVWVTKERDAARKNSGELARPQLLKDLRITAAGAIAERIHTGEPTGPWPDPAVVEDDDLYGPLARLLAATPETFSRVSDELESVSCVRSAWPDSEIAEVLESARADAESLLRDNWDWVESVARQLTEFGTVSFSHGSRENPCPNAQSYERIASALAECAAISGEWLRRVDQARDDPARMEQLGGLIPSVFADVMTRAAAALEAAGYDVAAEIDAAVERIGESGTRSGR